MTVPVIKVTKQVQTDLDNLPTTFGRIKYLTALGWDKADIARKLGILYQHVWNEQQRLLNSKTK